MLDWTLLMGTLVGSDRYAHLAPNGSRKQVSVQRSRAMGQSTCYRAAPEADSEVSSSVGMCGSNDAAC